MNIFPAIDIYEGKVVRLTKGDYNKMTIYSDNPVEVAKRFVDFGASYLHIVDLEGAKEGKLFNFEIITKIKNTTGIFCEVGGGIRNSEVIEKYISAGIDRVILGTAAIENKDFLEKSIKKFENKIAVSLDILDEKILIKGWRAETDINFYDYLEYLESVGLDCIICTDISKDGVLKGINRNLYKKYNDRFTIKIIASGGVTTLDDIKYLKELNLYGAIIGKAYYNKTIDICEAIKMAEK